MKTLKDYLIAKEVSADLISVIETVTNSIVDIAAAVRKSDGSKAGSSNIYGEEQLALDVLSDKIMMDHLKKNEKVGLVGSEELDDETVIGEGDYAVCSDPLDGSSLVDVNLSVGTIVGIYKAKTFIGTKGDDQVSAIASLYGPSTTMFLTVKKGLVQFKLNEDGEWVLMKDDIQVGEGKMFAPGNLRACSERDDYLKLLNFWVTNQYTLRYSGGMIPDINQIFLKGKGIFSYPGYGDAPDGKLRLLYECAPMSLLMEQAGGMSSDGKMRLLDKDLKDLGQRSPIFIGSNEEVQRCEEYLA